jgi:acyl carrier protein
MTQSSSHRRRVTAPVKDGAEISRAEVEAQAAAIEAEAASVLKSPISILDTLEPTQGREITLDSNLHELGLNSLHAVELALEIEERLGVEVPDKDIEGLVTVSDWVDYIQTRLPSTSS